MIALYVCDCGCFHGWKEDDARIVRLVTRHIRGMMEDIWWCPSCGKEHRTGDGTVMGQPCKKWRDATAEEIALIEKGVDPRMDARDGVRVRFGPNGAVYYTCNFRR